jgi:hypothetical protein
LQVRSSEVFFKALSPINVCLIDDPRG